MKFLSYIFVLLLSGSIFNSCENGHVAKFSQTAMGEKGSINLPNDFKDRKFLKQLVVERNNPTLLPGRLIKVESVDTSSQALNVYRLPYLFSKENAEPGLEILKDDKLIKLKVTNNSGASASIKAILDLNIEANHSYEIFLSDILSSTLPDGGLDTAALISFYQRNIDPSKAFDYYFVSNVKVSRYSYKKFNEIKGGTTVNGGSVFALEGKLYNSRDGLFQDYFISASLLPLVDLLPRNIEPQPAIIDGAIEVGAVDFQIFNLKMKE